MLVLLFRPSFKQTNSMPLRNSNNNNSCSSSNNTRNSSIMRNNYCTTKLPSQRLRSYTDAVPQNDYVCKVDKKTQTFPLKKHSWSQRLLPSFRRRRSTHNAIFHEEIEPVVKKVVNHHIQLKKECHFNEDFFSGDTV